MLLNCGVGEDSWESLGVQGDWRQEEKEITEDKIVGWHHQLNGHEFEQAPRGDKGQGSLACCSPWSHKELVTIERLNSNKTVKADQCQMLIRKLTLWYAFPCKQQNPEFSCLSRSTVVLPGLFSITTGLVLQLLASLRATKIFNMKICLLTYNKKSTI